MAGLLLCTAAHADNPAAADKVTEAQLALWRLSSALDLVPPCPADHWRIYLDASGIDGFDVREVRLRGNSGPPQVRRYGGDERRALGGAGVDRPFCLPPHEAGQSLRLTVAGKRPHDSRPSSQEADTELALDPSRPSRAVVLALRRPALRRRGLALGARWHASDEAVRAPHPELDYARFLADTGRTLQAYEVLRQLRREAPEATGPEWDWVLGEVHSAFGLFAQAHAAFQSWLPERFAILDSGRRRESLLALAERQVVHGRTAGARKTLGMLEARLDPAQELRRKDILSRSLLAEARFDQALDALASDDAEGLYLYTPYMRFNVGIALLHSGDDAQGVLVLERLGQIRPADEAEAAVRDLANVLLGEHFLARQQGGTAKPYFQAVRLDGPYTARALLGWGWSELAPAGEAWQRPPLERRYDDRTPISESAPDALRQRFGYWEADTAASLRMLRHLRLDLHERPADALDRASLAWRVLESDYPDAPYLLQAGLALAYAQEQKGLKRQALQRYDAGLRALDSLSERLSGATHALSNGNAWEPLAGMIATPGAHALGDWLLGWAAEHRAQRMLDAHRWLRAMRADVSRWRDDGDVDAAAAEEALRAIDHADAALREALRTDAVALLDVWASQVREMQSAALQSAARLQERMALTAAP